MDEDKVYFLISIPNDFYDKFCNLLKNANTTNCDKDTPPIKIESVYCKEYAAIPKEKGVENG